MDLISSRTMDITKLAMDGLMERQRAISANTANVMTPGYQRQEVSFEDQLKGLIDEDKARTTLKERNSIEYNPQTLDTAVNRVEYAGENKSLTPQQMRFLASGTDYGKFSPETATDMVAGDDTGNNVDLEKEIMDMASVGIKYNTLVKVEAQNIKLVSTAIKGEV